MVSIHIAQAGKGSPTGYTIDLRLNTIADWIAQNTIVPPTLLAQVVETNLVLNWSGSFFLQSATNAAGPYLDFPTATAPHTNALYADAQRFFRLRSPAPPAARPALMPPTRCPQNNRAPRPRGRAGLTLVGRVTPRAPGLPIAVVDAC